MPHCYKSSSRRTLGHLGSPFASTPQNQGQGQQQSKNLLHNSFSSFLFRGNDSSLVSAYTRRCKLSLGADGVLIGRPFVNMIYGAGAEGVNVLVEKLKAELADTMAMCGAHSIADIDRSMIFGY